jgi:putative copper resistance protein D
MVLDLATTQQAATVALNLSVAVITGASMSTAWLLAASSQWAARHLRHLRTVTGLAVAAATVAAFAVLWLEAAAMAEVPVASAASAVWSVLTATHYGLAWSIGIVAMAVVAATTATPWRPGRLRAAVALRLLAIGVFLYSRSIVSHAGAGGDVSWAVAADWLHLVLISLWVGEVLVAGFITLRGDTAADSICQDRLDRARYIEALSTSATIALTGIVVTGLFSAWRGLVSLDNATGNPYASVLLIKVSLVAAAAVLGGANRLLVMRRLIAQLRNSVPSGFASERRFALILQIEAVFLFAALILAAILSATSPPSAA